MVLRRYKIILISLFVILAASSAALGLIDNWFHYEQGLKLIAEKDYEHARKQFDYYLNLPEIHRHMFGIAYFGRGLMFQAMGKYDLAITEFQKAIENDLHPTTKISAKSYMNLGAIYLKNNAFQDGIAAYSAAIIINPKEGLAHYYLGIAYLRAGEYEKAEREAEEAKRLGVPFTALSEGLASKKNLSSKDGMKSGQPLENK